MFSSGTGGRRDKDTIRNRVLNPAIERANENLTNGGDLRLPGRLTLHGLRHAFASLLVALGEAPRNVMGQLGKQGSRATRPAGFEPAASCSGGKRSIH